MRNRGRCAGIGVVTAIVVATLGLPFPAAGQPATVTSRLATLPEAHVAPAPAGTSEQGAKRADPYYIEFRSRYAITYSHAFVVFGRGNGPGKKISPSQIAGLHPATDSPVPFWVGHVIPVASETGASEGDTDEISVSARYRLLLTKGEYDKVVAYIRELQKTKTMWQEMVYNCNSFIGDIATFVGLKTPLSAWVMPQTYVTELRDRNEGHPHAAIAQDTQSASPSRQSVQ